MKKNTKVLLAGSSIILTILILLIAATPGASGTEITIQEALANPDNYQERYITTEGFLVADSVDWQADEIELRFEIIDPDGNRLSVFHHGVRPDNFSEDVVVIVDGYLTAGEPFVAERLRTKCPSKYEGEDSEHYEPGKYEGDYDRELHQQIINQD